MGGFFGDTAVRHGIKYALAGLLAFYFAQLLRLETPSWSVTTVFVLMLAQYVPVVLAPSDELFLLRIMGDKSYSLLLWYGHCDVICTHVCTSCSCYLRALLPYPYSTQSIHHFQYKTL